MRAIRPSGLHGTTDRAIIIARKQLVDAMLSVQDGGVAPGTGEGTYKLRAYEMTMSEDAVWIDEMGQQLYEMAGAR